VTAPFVIPTTVAAVDWSGARAPSAQRKAICVAVVRESNGTAATELTSGRTREEAIELIAGLPKPVVVGFDFSFGAPEWFARELGCTTVDDMWALAARDGETWLRPQPPFWRDRCDVPVERRFRQCELALRPAKSIFQLVGNGQVGAGSVRGMPLLARLRAGGFAIWPFDAPAARTALEIYPSLLRRMVQVPDEPPVYATEHERDAAESARVVWEHRASFAMLTAAVDPTTRIEGDVWRPDL